jgi:phytoene dehydrogenase-like protein
MEFDAVVVGSGPNGLAAAIEVARAGHSVCVLEASDTIGGGARSAALTLSGFIHDVCSAVLPMTIASPFFRTLPLKEHGLEWVHPSAPLAHPFDDGTAALLEKSIENTIATLEGDALAYSRRFRPLASHAEELLPEILSPVIRVPRHPFLMMNFGLQAIQAASTFALGHFSGARARALFAGIAAHSNMPLDQRPTAAIGLVLGMLGHVYGWPVAKGGSQRLSDALAGYFRSLGGRIVTGQRVKSFEEVPSARAVFFDVPPKELLAITGDRFPPSYRRSLSAFKHSPGVFKVDWALNAAVPWKNSQCLRSATVHIGGTLEEIAAAESAPAEGIHAERPFVLLSQPSLFDESRAPSGKHTLWGYCHVPAGSSLDMTERIESQIERFAPGFRDCIIERRTISAKEYEAYNPNFVGGDISGGMQNLRQTFARPSLRRIPYTTPDPRIFICSSSTPPGGGVHGMCGYHAARAALSTALK